LNAVTPAPSATTVPDASAPWTTGNFIGRLSLIRIFQTTGLTLAAEIRMRTSPAAAVGMGMSCDLEIFRPPWPTSCMARIVAGATGQAYACMQASISNALAPTARDSAQVRSMAGMRIVLCLLR
jgi:hypothetical protein